MPPSMLQTTLPLPDLTLTGVIDILVVGFLIYQALWYRPGHPRGSHPGRHPHDGRAVRGGRVGGAWKCCARCSPTSCRTSALAIIVLFQSEIRRTLARIGRKRLARRAASGGPNRPTRSCWRSTAWPQQKTGALIVMERDIGLRTFIESGVRAGCAPLARPAAFHLPARQRAARRRRDRAEGPHRRGRLLPAAEHESRRSPRKLGTRHRAAIGITEETDCLSLVVSEETGRISVAAFGELEQGLTLREVEERINAPLRRRSGPGRASDEEEPADIPMATDGTTDKVKPQ